MDKTTKIVTAIAIVAALIFPAIAIFAGVGEEPAQAQSIENQ